MSASSLCFARIVFIQGYSEIQKLTVASDDASAVPKQLRRLIQLCDQMEVRSTKALCDTRQALMAERKAQSAAISSMRATFDLNQTAIQDYYSSLQTVPLQIQQLQQEAAKIDRSQRVLAGLPFKEMKDREEQIAEAYNNTFGWIFDDTTTSFKDWLYSGNGIFWVSGKAGSGKPTLMKFLADHR